MRPGLAQDLAAFTPTEQALDSIRKSHTTVPVELTDVQVSAWAAKARALSVRGRADIRIVDGVVEEYLAAARKSMDAEAAARFEQNCREMYDRMARIAITPRWVRYYDVGAGRMPKFLRELAERSGR